MTPFLKEIALQIFEEQRENLQNVHILVPNRRAILYLKKYLSELSDKPLWSPKMYSIEDFVFEVTGLFPCETVDLLFDLYAIHRIIAERDARSFDDFVQWGEQLLRDFNDIDFYLTEAHVVFSYLSDIKAVERWHIDGTELTESEKKYLEFYRSLGTYYAMLREKMKLENKAWHGLAYRLLSENFDSYFTNFNGKVFYIIGFNALTKSEETIFKSIQRNAVTTILWDADEYYVNNLQHEAGHFLRLNRKRFGKNFELKQNFKLQKNIVITGVPKNIGQVVSAGKVLAQLFGITDAPDDTAVVLNNEELLIPMLGFIPEKYEKFNITMGYPFKLTQLFNFFTKWIQLHLSGAGRFERQLFMDCLQHPVLGDFLHRNFPYSLDILIKNIEQNYRQADAFISYDAIQHGIFEGLENIFPVFSFFWESWENDHKKALEKMEQAVSFLRSSYAQTNDAVNMEFLFHLSRSVQRLKEIGENYSDGITIQSIFAVFNKILRSVKIPFSGEPIGGLQIMGMLETRLLDYKNIILLSVNEGIIPSETKNSSFIPFDVRRHFGLPTQQENNAVAAYHFYRLLQRAENIHIFYNADNGNGLSAAKEQSRFITQLLQELPAYNPAVRLSSGMEPLPSMTSENASPFIIRKTPFALERLNKMAEQGFSPSAINDYLNCPVEFYLKRIARIPDALELQNSVDAATFGTIIHETIRIIHQDLVRKPLKPTDIQPLFSHYKSILEEQFTKNWTGGNFQMGNNFLTFLSAQDYIQAFLEIEQKEITTANDEKRSYHLLYQELCIEHPFGIELGSGRKEVRLKGIIDRVVQIGDIIRVLDFKTGNVLNREIKIKNMEQFTAEKDSPKAIQLLIYSWLMQKNEYIPATCHMETGLFSFRRLNDGFLPLVFEGREFIEEDILYLAEIMLKEVLEEIFNPDIPFIPSEDSEAHKYSQFGLLYR